MTRARACITQLAAIISPSPSATAVQPESIIDTTNKTKAIISELVAVIHDTDDTVQMEQLFVLNDQLNSLLEKVPPIIKPVLKLQGLGLNLNGQDMKVNGNGQAIHDSPLGVEHLRQAEDDETPTTPRIDKGKGRAEPEPEEPEKVLSPTFLITESDDEYEDGNRYIPAAHLEDVASPTDR